MKGKLMNDINDTEAVSSDEETVELVFLEEETDEVAFTVDIPMSRYLIIEAEATSQNIPIDEFIIQVVLRGFLDNKLGGDKQSSTPEAI